MSQSYKSESPWKILAKASILEALGKYEEAKKMRDLAAARDIELHGEPVFAKK